MKNRITPISIAMTIALAVALLSGFLLPLNDLAHAAPPVFETTIAPGSRDVDENTPPGVNIGPPISATDTDESTREYGDTLTYSLGGTDAASFDINPSTGQLLTKAALNAEVNSSYSVTVTVTDSESPANTADQPVTITVNDLDEPPAAPAAPTVVSGEDDDLTDTVEQSTTGLKVVWHPPDNLGAPITGYEVQYKESTAREYTDDNVDHSGTATTADITGLKPDTSYQVRVRATSDESTNGAGEEIAPWSLVGTGSTNKEGNSPPQTDDSSSTRRVAENTPAGENVGSPVAATDQDTTTLTYRLDGPDADLFNFNTRTGQIRTKASLNHEDPRCYVDTAPADPNNTTTCTYRVTVTVRDGAGGSDAIGVNILVVDSTEAPSAPNRPIVRATDKSSTSLDVSWNEPENDGPVITRYEVQYRKGSDLFSDNGVMVTGTTATISGNNTQNTPWLEPDTAYQVRVRAINEERAGHSWSASGTGRTNRANHEPIFDDRPGSSTGSERDSTFEVARAMDENPRSGHIVGRVFADDEDNDRLTYRLQPSANTDEARAEAAMFSIDSTSGQIRTKADVTYSYEAIAASGTCGNLSQSDVGSDRCYTVTVEVWDGLDGNRVAEEEATSDDSITLKIGVRNRDEPPAVPTVTVTSPADNTKLIVVWDARNTGPEITNYDVQYRKGGGTFSDDNCQDTEFDDNCQNITGTTTTTILGLDEDTSYSVQVRAENAEGTSAWSRLVTVKTNKGTNDPPTFDTAGDLTLNVNENTPAGRDLDTAVSAQELGSSSLTYRLEGRDAAQFTIVSSTGQIRTRASLNHEDPTCGYDSTDVTTECTYKVIVKVDDGEGGSTAKEVTINVVDVDETPSKPGAPRVTATKDTGWSLDVTWTEPRDTGRPPISDYDVQYRKFKSVDPDDWQLWPHGTDIAGNTDTSAEITRRLPAENSEPLEPRTQYEVRVRAKNGEGDATPNWSSVGRGTTGPSNSRPRFDRPVAVVELRIDENTRSGQNLGSAISASDADSNSLTYTLEGPGADSFTIVSTSGQIRTRSPLDYETRRRYSLAVKVDDRQKRSNSVATKSVTIIVDDVQEPPSPPAAPTVAGITGSTDSVRVTWGEPANMGPKVTGYDVHYREVGSGWGRWTHFGADRSTIITGLKAGTRYEVQVRARNAEGTGDWSRIGTGAPNPDVANRNPAFSGAARTLSVAENTSAGTDVGAPIAATDRDGDTLTYTLEGAGADSFAVLSTSDGGQIRTVAELNFEEQTSYSVTIRVTDDRGGSDSVNMTIRVTDVDGEAPDTPFAPTVTAISSTRLQVSWDAPDNQGPPITGYDYRYREASGSWTEVTGITGNTVTIQGLAAGTSYDVEVRARNAEGTSDWSNPGIGSTNITGANNPPVFSEGVNATRSVIATAQAGTYIGPPVTATDADTADTLTFSLEGRDAALFEIDATDGQLLTRSGITLLAGVTYGVTVAADDGIDTARIAVVITVTAAPPNNPPVFAEGASATRSVSGSAQAGTSIGRPVTATDADPGATLTYSIEGPNAASFGINGSTGQLLTRAGVTLPAASYPVTVIARDQLGASGRITVTITILPNVAPVFSSTRMTRNVSENVPAGTVVGGPVTASDADNDALTYTLGGADAALFAIASRTGQITVGSGTALDYETQTSYTVVVTATDPSGESDTTTVTVRVTNVTTEADRFDTDGDGAVDRDEVFGAIQQFLTGQASRDDVLGVILRFISG